MSLRKLTVEIELSPASTGQRAKQEHKRLVAAVAALLADVTLGSFRVPLYDTHGNEVGTAALSNQYGPPKETPDGDR